jgi:hypothetical protein
MLALTGLVGTCSTHEVNRLPSRIPDIPATPARRG